MPNPYRYDASLDELELDPENPRLPEDEQVTDQRDLIATLAADYSLTEIARSFIDNGYFQEEPLIAVKIGDRFRVVEGNRRLATLKLLTNPTLLKSLALGGDWTELSQQFEKQPIEKIPMLVYEKRDQIVPYLGFRHISGVKQWDPREKARFIDSLLKDGTRSFAEVARIVGSNSQSVRDSYLAYRLMRQARDKFEIDTSRLEDEFGVLLRAVSSAAIKSHLGVDTAQATPTSLREPLRPDHVQETREIVDWIFGSHDNLPVIRESRQLTDLGKIIEDPHALEVLRTSNNFALAKAEIGGEESSIIENLRKASYYLDEVKREIDRHVTNVQVQDLVERCRRSMNSVVTLMGAHS
jgi:hypothetical protein